MCLLIPALKKLRQEDGGFRVSLGYIIRPYLEGKKKKKKRVTLLSSRNSHFNWELESVEFHHPSIARVFMLL